LGLDLPSPLRLSPIDGAAASNQGATLFRPAATDLDPTLGLSSATISVAGSFSLTDTGSYTLSLKESGPDGSGSFTFTESGTLTFSLTEQGTFTAGGLRPQRLPGFRGERGGRTGVAGGRPDVLPARRRAPCGGDAQGGRHVSGGQHDGGVPGGGVNRLP
jgi:hypothetical protein